MDNRTDFSLLHEIYVQGGRQALDRAVASYADGATETEHEAISDLACRVMEGAVARSLARLDQAEARAVELEAEARRLQAEIDELVEGSLARFLADPEPGEEPLR